MLTMANEKNNYLYYTLLWEIIKPLFLYFFQIFQDNF